MIQSKPVGEGVSVPKSHLVMPFSGGLGPREGEQKGVRMSRTLHIVGFSAAVLLGITGCSQTPEVFVVDAPVDEFEAESQLPALETFHDDVQMVDSGIVYDSSWDPDFPYYVVWADFKNNSHQVVYEFSIRYGADDANGDQWAALETSYSTYQILPQQRITVFEELWDTRSSGEPAVAVIQTGATDTFLVTPEVVGEPEVTDFQWEHVDGYISGTGQVTNPLGAAIEDMHITVWCTDALGNIFVSDGGRPDAVPLNPGDELGFVFDSSLSDRHFIQSCQPEVLVLGYEWDDITTR